MKVDQLDGDTDGVGIKGLRVGPTTGYEKRDGHKLQGRTEYQF